MCHVECCLSVHYTGQQKKTFFELHKVILLFLVNSMTLISNMKSEFLYWV